MKLLLTKLRDRADIYNLHEFYMREHLLSQSKLIFVVMRGLRATDREEVGERERQRRRKTLIVFVVLFTFYHLFKKIFFCWKIGKCRLEKERQTERRAGRKAQNTKTVLHNNVISNRNSMINGTK